MLLTVHAYMKFYIGSGIEVVSAGALCFLWCFFEVLKSFVSAAMPYLHEFGQLLHLDEVRQVGAPAKTPLGKRGEQTC